MTRYLIEEVHELVDAVLAQDAGAVCEEAGDVLFQLLFLIHLYQEAGHFRFADVIERNLTKMVRRHPHVFGDGCAKTARAVSENWDRIKRAERKGTGAFEPLLGSVPRSLPALARAAMVSERAAKIGFDWDDINGVMAQTMEEWREFSAEVHSGPNHVAGPKAAEEFGDILFSLVNVARFARIHPETALIQAIQKFEKRFNYMEAKAGAAGRDLNNLTAREMQALWDAAKGDIG